MNALIRSAFGAGLVAALIITLAGCASPSTKHLASGDGQYLVQISPASNAGTRLSHPATLETSALASKLRALHFEEPGLLGSASSRPVFDQEEISRLAPALSQALAQARADQRVDFLSFPGSGSNLGNARKTEGTLFIDPQGQLNIALSAVRQVMTVDDDFTRFREISMGDPLAVDRAMVNLVWERDAFSARRQNDGSPYPLWVVAANGQTAHEITEAQVDLQATREAAPPPARRAEPPTRESAPDRPGTVAADEVAPSSTPEAVRERLEFLRALHEDGLISAEEYERERARALSRLE